MFISKAMRSFLLFTIVMHASLAARDVIVEFKGAGFVPTSSRFRDIYGNGAALFGPEITVGIYDTFWCDTQVCDTQTCDTQVCGAQRWYAFASVDYLKKDGDSIGLCDDTTVRMVPLAFGIKCFESVCYGNLYAGLGFQPTHLRTTNCSPGVVQEASQWCLGGIAKLGAYIDVKCNFVCDLFVNYSFVKASCPKLCRTETEPLAPLKANISGVVLGVGLGYRFN